MQLCLIGIIFMYNIKFLYFVQTLISDNITTEYLIVFIPCRMASRLASRLSLFIEQHH